MTEISEIIKDLDKLIGKLKEWNWNRHSSPALLYDDNSLRCGSVYPYPKCESKGCHLPFYTHVFTKDKNGEPKSLRLCYHHFKHVKIEL